MESNKISIISVITLSIIELMLPPYVQGENKHSSFKLQ